MPIVNTIGCAVEFAQQFLAYGEDRWKQMGENEGCEMLFNYLEGIYTEETWEMDVIALCCDYAYYENLSEFLVDYGDDDTDMSMETDLSIITDNTTLITGDYNEKEILAAYLEEGDEANTPFIIQKY